ETVVAASRERQGDERQRHHRREHRTCTLHDFSSLCARYHLPPAPPPPKLPPPNPPKPPPPLPPNPPPPNVPPHIGGPTSHERRRRTPPCAPGGPFHPNRYGPKITSRMIARMMRSALLNPRAVGPSGDGAPVSS